MAIFTSTEGEAASAGRGNFDPVEVNNMPASIIAVIAESKVNYPHRAQVDLHLTSRFQRVLESI
jgi:hypothetical protein